MIIIEGRDQRFGFQYSNVRLESKALLYQKEVLQKIWRRTEVELEASSDFQPRVAFKAAIRDVFERKIQNLEHLGKAYAQTSDERDIRDILPTMQDTIKRQQDLIKLLRELALMLRTKATLEIWTRGEYEQSLSAINALLKTLDDYICEHQHAIIRIG